MMPLGGVAFATTQGPETIHVIQGTQNSAIFTAESESSSSLARLRGSGAGCVDTVEPLRASFCAWARALLADIWA